MVNVHVSIENNEFVRHEKVCKRVHWNVYKIMNIQNVGKFNIMHITVRVYLIVSYTLFIYLCTYLYR